MKNEKYDSQRFSLPSEDQDYNHKKAKKIANVHS